MVRGNQGYGAKGGVVVPPSTAQSWIQSPGTSATKQAAVAVTKPLAKSLAKSLAKPLTKPLAKSLAKLLAKPLARNGSWLSKPGK